MTLCLTYFNEEKSMNSIELIQKEFASYLCTTFGLNEIQAKAGTFTLNVDENKQQFGDLNANAPMIIAKMVGKKPQDIAQTILTEFKHPLIESMELQGAGFLNARLTIAAIQKLAAEISHESENFFRLGQSTPRKKFSIEFVSANPTGPLTFGHGRGGIIGDVLGNILRFIGHNVTKEYYINDAGSQMAKLGMSLKIRILQQLGTAIELPEDSYRGEYIIDVARQCIEENGSSVVNNDDQFFIEYGYKNLLAKIKTTLINYGINFDIWFSENSLHTSGAIEHALELLTQQGYLYEQDGALWFKATHFGDDKDRVVKKSSGEYTYAAADIAYILNKAKRGFDGLIMTLGHDHHSYALRLEAIRQALGITSSLDVILYQLVRMQASGQLVRMSKRAGNIVTLDDVIDTVGKDVARFFYLNRKADAQLVFDLDLALKKTDENPVYYIQYAYVRTNSIKEKAQMHPQLLNVSSDDCIHIGREEVLLIKKIVSLKELLESISTNHQTHLIAYYTIELSTLFHRYYAQNRVIDLDNIHVSRARLYVTTLLNSTLKLCLTLMGIECPTSM